jgi:3-dehydroquinate dehydratase-1
MDFMGKIEGLSRIYAALSTPVIATNRPVRSGGHFDGSEDERMLYLLDAIEAGCELVDVEIDAPFKDGLVKQARKKDCKVIVSMHDHEKTPSSKELLETVKKEKEEGADIGKVVTFARSIDDCHRVLDLILKAKRINFPLVAFTMGPLGKFTRVMAPFYGAPFTYASFNKKVERSQIDVKTLRMIYEGLK